MAHPTTHDFNGWEKSKKGAATKAKRGKAVHHRVERANNGFVSHTEFEPKGGMNDRMAMMDHSGLTKKMIHKTPEEMGSHASVMMGGRPLIPSAPANDEANEATGAGDTAAEAAAESAGAKA